MKTTTLFSVILFLCLILHTETTYAYEAIYWQPATNHGSKGHGHQHKGKSFTLVNGNPQTSVNLIDSKLNSRPLELHQQSLSIKPTGLGNYHAIVATQISATTTKTAVRYPYLYGKPSGESPSALTALEKGALEIEPQPLAREHRLYHSGNPATFLVRFHGTPLALHTVTFITSNGSKESYQTDEEGMLYLTLPEDFSDIKVGTKGNKPAEFVLSTAYESEGHQFISSTSADYHVNPNHWQSTPLGASTVLIGMVIGTLITLRRNREKQ